jgi:lysine 2,3-aminomutase
MNAFPESSFDAYGHRPSYFKNIDRKTWSSWVWQQQNALRTTAQLQKVFPQFPSKYLAYATAWEKRGFRFLLTPYVLALTKKDRQGNPLPTDPVWRQIFPLFDQLLKNHAGPPDEYSPQNENWEVAKEMITPIAQHKYDNRVIIYTADACLGYCVYCFRSLQSNAGSEKHGGRPHWQETLKAIRSRPRVEEVILSGGDPLLYDNHYVESMLHDLREISSVKAIRIHTRAWLHNPYRIDKDFCVLLKKYQVTEIGVHIVHPCEMTKDFQQAVQRIRESGARTMLLTDTPLIKGINDNAKILHQLFMALYLSGIKPYYLSHNMPNIPAAATQRTSVKKGLALYNSLKRHISNTAMPEYIICHESGKRTVPETPESTADFLYQKDQNGHPTIRFKNWKGEWATYIDAKE